jgi:cytochrome P450
VAEPVTVSRLDRLSLPIVRSIASKPRLTELLFGRTRWGNQFTPDASRDPYPTHEVIRADGPVTWHPLYRQWFVTGYDEALAILSSPDVIVGGQRELVLACRPHSKMSPHCRDLMRKFLLFVDPPDHTRLRRLVSRAFSPRQVARLEAAAERQAECLLAALGPVPCVDMFAAFNAPFPIQVIADLLGIPEEDWAWTRTLSDALTRFLDPFPDFDVDAVDALLGDGIAYFDQLVEARRITPTDDLISDLVAAEDENDRLDRFETVAIVMFLMFAGHETTSGMLGNAMLALAEFPEQRAWVRDEPERWPNAVEELLRYDTALQIDPRAAGADFTVGGQTIRKGQNIILMLGAANRDPRRWPDADVLRLDRDDPRPISFGHGIHHCLGAALARMELRVGLRRFVEGFGDYTIDPEEVVWKEHMVLRGPIMLPVCPQARPRD